MTDDLDEMQEFEKSIVNHWQELNRKSIEEIDFLDALTDFFSLHPNIDPEDVKFSDAFKNRVKIDADARKLLKKSSKEKKSDEIAENSNELEI
jgi:putative heme iron utilization protein